MNRHTLWLLGTLVLAQAGNAGAADLAAVTFTEHVDAQGRIELPRGYRHSWVHLGSWLVADPNAPGHGFHDVYTQPQAVQTYMRTGRFPDGTVLIKEIRTIRSGPLTTGQAQWAAAPSAWFVMIKDARGRFPGDPHWEEGWGWALFEAGNLKINASRGFAETCKGCHLPAAHDDWVFVGGYPTLGESASTAHPDRMRGY